MRSIDENSRTRGSTATGSAMDASIDADGVCVVRSPEEGQNAYAKPEQRQIGGFRVLDGR